jgi:hypothetical protein
MVFPVSVLFRQIILVFAFGFESCRSAVFDSEFATGVGFLLFSGVCSRPLEYTVVRVYPSPPQTSHRTCLRCRQVILDHSRDPLPRACIRRESNVP